jgi:hypothetical protein
VGALLYPEKVTVVGKDVELSLPVENAALEETNMRGGESKSGGIIGRTCISSAASCSSPVQMQTPVIKADLLLSDVNEASEQRGALFESLH